MHEKYTKLIIGQQNFIDKLIAENELLREIVLDEHRKYLMMMENRNKYKVLYETLKAKLRGVCDD